MAKRQDLAAEVIRRLAELNPDPKCELHHHTPFQLLVSVVLSAQTTDKGVNKATAVLYTSPDSFTPQSVLTMGEAAFLAKIRTIGLAPTKARNVLKLAEMVQTQHKGQVPHTREALEALPGVGRKTASVILGEVYGEPTLAVDTHVYRVTKRLDLHDAASPQDAEPFLLKVFPESTRPKAHHWLILHGRYTCLARKPLCAECVVNDLCSSRDKTVALAAPAKQAKITKKLGKR